MVVEEDESLKALTIYKSPPPPKISDFLVEAWTMRSDKMVEVNANHGFQLVKRKSKRIPIG